MSRVYNFSAGPAVLPEEVLKEAAAEMLDYKGTGMSVIEMSHRSKAFEEIITEAEQDLRDLMNIPDNYKVLFLQGGASQQFAMIPMNLMKNKVADYIVTGQWAKKTAKEAEKYGKVNVVASSVDKTFSYIPDCSDLPISEDADYVYICENNTIYGTSCLTAVAISFIFIRKHPSPAIFTTILSGHPVFAPMAAPRPYPIVPRPPDVKSVLGFVYL